MKQVKFTLEIILLLVVVILTVQNHEAMSTEVTFRVKFFSYSAQSSHMSLYYIVTIAFLFGLIISGLYGIIERFRLKKTIKVLKGASQEKDQELNSLRNLPITSDEVNSNGLEDA